MPKKQLDLNGHIALGNKIKHIYDQLRELVTAVDNAFAKDTGLGAYPKDAQKAIMALQYQLDEMVCTQFKHDQTINPEKIYYCLDSVQEEKTQKAAQTGPAQTGATTPQ